MGHWHDDEPCPLSDKECDALFGKQERKAKVKVRVRTYIDDKQYSDHVLDLDCVVGVALLGIEISKDARIPSELRVVVDKVVE